jgi:3',5'-cyclic AMP phosphodiesterase CpdA
VRRAALLLVAVVGAISGCGGPGGAPVVPASPAAPPPEGTIRYIAGGDSRDDAAHVMPWAIAEAKARGASGFFFLGDMELSPALLGHFAQLLPSLDPIPFFPVLGNHEVKMLGVVGIGQKGSENAFRAKFLGVPRTPVQSALADRVAYSTNLPGGVHFVALDNVSHSGFGADQLSWLASDLARARADSSTKYVIVGMHKPLAHNGLTSMSMEMDGSAAEADSNAALDLFEKANVSLILASHVHAYEAGEIRGIRQYVSGGLGAPLSHWTGAAAFHHFLQIDVDDDGLHVTAVRFPGAPSTSEDDDKD